MNSHDLLDPFAKPFFGGFGLASEQEGDRINFARPVVGFYGAKSAVVCRGKPYPWASFFRPGSLSLGGGTP